MAKKPVIIEGKHWKETKILVTILSRVSKSGGTGLYLYLPGDHADIYGVKAGDKMEVRLIRSFTLTEAPGETEINVDEDLSSSDGRKKKNEEM